MFPAFAHFRRTATCDTELHGQKIREGEKVVMWYVSSNRDETRFEDPDRFDVRATPSTRRSAPAAGTSAWARRSRAWS
jgi:cytochrome P450